MQGRSDRTPGIINITLNDLKQKHVGECKEDQSRRLFKTTACRRSEQGRSDRTPGIINITFNDLVR